jgi:hypothetical protein
LIEGAVETLIPKVTDLRLLDRSSMLPGVTNTKVGGFCPCAGTSDGTQWEKFDEMESRRSEAKIMRLRVPERFKP